MISVQSPQFSSSSKIDLAAKMSPSFRYKRIPSAQDNYNNHWNRANSCKRLDSPSKISQKHRKRSHNSQQRVKSKTNISHNIVEQLGTLKNQYTSLKIAYQDLIQNKVQIDEQSNKLKNQAKRFKEDNEKLIKQNSLLKSKVAFLELEIQRIRRESLKLIQIQQFKTHKLQQNLIEKQKAISNLIQSFKIDAKIQVAVLNTYDTEQPNALRTQSELNPINSAHLQSLTLSKDKTLTNSQFISISLSSMMQNESQNRHQLSTRRHNISYIDCQKNKVQQIASEKSLHNKSNKQNQPKVDQNFKKLRKQIVKKIEVNIDERNKQQKCKQSVLEGKTSKSNKASKTKIRDQSLDCRSSKKKISSK